MKADNEPAISLPTLFKSVKNENMFKTTNESKKTKENEKKKKFQRKKERKKEKVSSGGNRAPDHRCMGSSLYLLRHTMKGETHLQNQLFPTFSFINSAVLKCCLMLVELYL